MMTTVELPGRSETSQEPPADTSQPPASHQIPFYVERFLGQFSTTVIPSEKQLATDHFTTDASKTLERKFTELKEIPARRIASNYEPHARVQILREIHDSIQSVISHLGQPGMPVATATLRRELVAQYETAGARNDTRMLATLISSLQDYFTQHWSQFPEATLVEIDALVRDAMLPERLSPRAVSHLIQRMAQIRGSVVQFPTDSLYVTMEDDGSSNGDGSVD